MKKKINIEVEIEYVNDICLENCIYLYLENGYVCLLFDRRVKWDDGYYIRCQKCIEATEEK
jgi:hypothetical protein